MRGFSVHFVLGFQDNSICTLNLYFGLDLQNGAKFIQKTNPWFKKSNEELGQLQTSSRVLKVEI